MNELTEIKKLRRELEKRDRELKSYQVAANIVGEHAKKISLLNHELESTKNKLSLILETTSDAIRLIDRDFNVIEINRAMEELMGISRRESIKKKCFDICRFDFCNTENCYLKRAIAEERRISGEHEILRSDGTRIFCIVTSSPLRNERNEITAVVEDIIDITAIKKMLKKLEYSANYDSLTNVYSRGKLFELLDIEIERVIRYKEDFSLILLDIDFFKGINDSHGHITGDNVLKGVSSLIRQDVRTPDILGRYGGDEFAIILPNTGLEHARKMAERIRKKIETTEMTDLNLYLTISQGLTVYKPNEEHNLLIARADKNLYKAKEMGRNRVEASY